jgi:hypothetical protein
MSREESEVIKVVNEELDRRELRILRWAIAGLLTTIAAIVTCTWILSSYLHTIENTLKDAARIASEQHGHLEVLTARVAKLERFAANPVTRWTVSMQREWAVLMRDWSPGMPTPSVDAIQQKHMPEITP